MSRPKLRLREKRREKVRRGWCRKDLHRLVGDNVDVLADGYRLCRACDRARRRLYRVEAVALGLQRIKCMARGCHTTTERYSDAPYICPRHQQQEMAA